LIAMVVVGAVYGRTQKKQRYHTQTELELTERLLGDVQDEKDRATEEITVMEQAWSIDTSDLVLGKVIGQGAFGEVMRGMWGHIPVAVRPSLLTPLRFLSHVLTLSMNGVSVTNAHAQLHCSRTVQVKVLRQPLDDLDPLMREDFDREVLAVFPIGPAVCASMHKVSRCAHS
jgi:hypothetical protein